MSNLKSKNHNLNFKSNIKYRAYYFSLAVLKFVESLPNKKIYWTISDQLLRSSTSIGANIIEATASSSKKDFIKFYQIALKSANETRYWLGLLRDSGLVKSTLISELAQDNLEIAKMLGASLLTLKGKR